MKETRFGFQYSWADTKPIRALTVVVLAAQIAGALLGLFLAKHDQLFLRLWLGGAVATFPGFLAGLFVQSRMRPGSLSENRVMVRRFGLVALVLTLAAPMFAARLASRG